MPLVYADLVKETTTTTGTGTYSLAGAETGFQSFVDAIGNGNTCYYVVTDGTSWEIGLGTVTDASPDTLSRDTILESSNSGSAVNWSAGSKNVFVTYPAFKISNPSPMELSANIATEIPLSIELASSQTANAIEVNLNGVSGGEDGFVVGSDCRVGVPLGSTSNPSVHHTDSGANQSGIAFESGRVRLLGNAYADAGQFDGVSATLPGSLSMNGTLKGYKPQVANATTTTIGGQIGRLYRNTGAVTLTLPSSPSDGDHYEFLVANASNFRIQANSGQTIQISDTSTATAGYIESSSLGSYVRLRYISNVWYAIAIKRVWTDGTFTYNDTGLIT